MELLLQLAQWGIPQGWQTLLKFKNKAFLQVRHVVEFVQVWHPSGHLEQLPLVKMNMPIRQDEQIGAVELLGKKQVIQKGNVS